MEMLRETFFMKGFITAMVIAVLTKVIVWANYHRLLVSSEEMERPKRYWIGTLKKKIENYYNLQTSLYRSVRKSMTRHLQSVRLIC